MGSISPSAGQPSVAGVDRSAIAHRRAGEKADLKPSGTATDQLAEHFPDLLRHAHRLIPNVVDAQDLAQDTMERAMRAFDRFQSGTNLRAWLYTILVRRACDYYRQNRQHRRAEAMEPDTLPAPPAPEPSAWTRVTDAQLEEAVSRLPTLFREVFELHEIHHLAYQEVAHRLRIPVGTVGTRLRRAREKLQQLLRTMLENAGGAP